MKLVPIIRIEQPETVAEVEAAHRNVMRIVGNSRMDYDIQQVPFHFGAQLLHYVNFDLYDNSEQELAWRINNRYWMTDDFRVFVDPNTNLPVFYVHFAHGDCDFTYFTVED